ncbi:unnamed protein product [Chrysoparadoxa australica]
MGRRERTLLKYCSAFALPSLWPLAKSEEKYVVERLGQIMEDGEDDFVVEVKWKGYKETTWMKVSSINEDIPHMFKKVLDKQAPKKKQKIREKISKELAASKAESARKVTSSSGSDGRHNDDILEESEDDMPVKKRAGKSSKELAANKAESAKKDTSSSGSDDDILEEYEDDMPVKKRARESGKGKGSHEQTKSKREKKEVAVSTLYCALCKVRMPRDSFSDKQKKKNIPDGKRYCLHHHLGGKTGLSAMTDPVTKVAYQEHKWEIDELGEIDQDLRIRVKWLGNYDDTWEPIWTMYQDVPDKFEEALNGQRGSIKNRAIAEINRLRKEHRLAKRQKLKPGGGKRREKAREKKELKRRV